MQFSEFKLMPDILKGIDEAGYSECTVVQQETLQHTLSGRDVFVQSQTGTGKTAAFLVSLFELMARSGEKEQALVISPTRELAVQIAEEAKLLSLYLDLNIVTVYGGVGYTPQIRAIEAGADILIGTPGRLIDMSDKKMLNLHQFSYLVIDEADRMFDMGFVQDIQTILYRLPSRQSRQTMLFSATLSTAVKQLAAKSMNEPTEVHIESENITVDAIDQQLYHVGSSQKMELLLGILKKFNVSRTLIFVNMKHMAEELAERLKGNGLAADYLTGDLPQRQRLRRIEMFKNNELPILIATDVAARGLHIDDLELVVNFDIPMHNENYVHRIGRTARAGKSGHAITLACETYVEFLAPIEEFIKMKIPSIIAEEELYIPDATAGKSFRRNRRSSSERGGSGGSRGGHGGRRSGPGSRSSSSHRDGGRGRSGSSSSHGGSQRGGRPGDERSGQSSRRRRPESYSDDSGNQKQQRPPRQQQQQGQESARPHRRRDEGRIPSSHGHDGKSFEQHQHPSGSQPHQKEAPKKKGFIAKVMSLFK